MARAGPRTGQESSTASMVALPHTPQADVAMKSRRVDAGSQGRRSDTVTVLNRFSGVAASQ